MVKYEYYCTDLSLISHCKFSVEIMNVIFIVIFRRNDYENECSGTKLNNINLNK